MTEPRNALLIAESARITAEEMRSHAAWIEKVEKDDSALQSVAHRYRLAAAMADELEKYQLGRIKKKLLSTGTIDEDGRATAFTEEEL